MTLRVVPAPAGDILVGETWDVTVDVSSDDGTPVTDAVLTASVTDPLTASTTPTVTAHATVPGRYVASVPLTRPGRWVCIVTGDGSADAGAVVAVETGGPPTLSQLKIYLDFDGELRDDATLAETLASEIAAQSRLCGVRVQWPPDLRAALLRRCAVALAKRDIPLSIVGVESEAGATRIPMWDAEIRRLEGPFRRLPCG